MVFYFTGTGNSRYIAEIISKRLDDDIVSLNEKIKQNDYSEIHSDRPIVFVFPIYALADASYCKRFHKKGKIFRYKKGIFYCYLRSRKRKCRSFHKKSVL